MELQDIIDLTANILAIAIMVVKACKVAAPKVRWFACQTATKTVLHWRKVVIGMVAIYAASAFAAYGFTGGVDGSAPLWATAWYGNLPLFLWGCAVWQGWLAVRWMARRAWPMI